MEREGERGREREREGERGREWEPEGQREEEKEKEKNKFKQAKPFSKKVLLLLLSTVLWS